MKTSCLIYGMVIGFVLLLTGCAVGPDYVKPQAPQPQKWLEEEDPLIMSEPTDFGQWWTVFNDPDLNTLVDMASQQNLSLRIAGIRILEARAQLGIAIGDLYPQQQSAGGSATYTSASENAANTSPVADFNYGSLDLGFDAAWELDFWGKFRRAVESNVGQLETSIASYDDILVTLTAEVARTYVFIRTQETLLMIARENVKIQEQSLKIVETRFKEGDITELDVQQAQTLLQDTKATIPRIQIGLRQGRNGLAILLGMLPGKLETILTSSKPIPTTPAEAKVGIPSELLRRRPDIRLAERQLASQSALIGVAKADLYPHFTLFGSIGLQSTNADVTSAGYPGGSSFSDLWASDSVYFMGGPAISWNIFNYGRVKNRVRVQDARFQQLVVNYQDTVLKAAQEVEDAMVAYLRTQDEVGFLAESVKAATRSVELSMIQYQEGMVDYQRVLDTQRSQSQAQNRLADVKGSLAQNFIALYKALGGGWQIREGKEFVPEETIKAMQERTDWGNLLTPTIQEEIPPDEEDRLRWRAPEW
ncbi:MAG: efflux transporter outer membrane subunit [Desulfobacterales bacterium]|nr:efflux transporter outer membrane subunit [Desulfobacterales bacterium]